MTNEQLAFFGLVTDRVQQLDQEYGPLSTQLAGLESLQRRVGRVSIAVKDRDHLNTHRQLVALLAEGFRLIRDTGLLTESDAVAADNALWRSR